VIKILDIKFLKYITFITVNSEWCIKSIDINPCQVQQLLAAVWSCTQTSVPTARTDLLVQRTQRIVLTGDIPQPHSEQLYGLHSSPNVIRVIKSVRMGWAGHVARVWDSSRAYKGLVGRPDAKRRVGKPRHWWDNIKMDLENVGWGGTNWIALTQDRDRWRVLVNAVMNLRVP
jgi:hypothetical protein